MLKFLNFQR